MRILHISPTYLPAIRYGGPIYTVHALCRALVARGHEVEVFTTDIDGAGSSAVPLKTPVQLDGVSITYFGSRHLRRLAWAPAMGHALSKRIGDFDVVHGHSVFLWPTWIAARAAKRVGKPYILSPRGALVRSLIERRNKIIKTAWIALIERRNVEEASALHATSDVEAADLRGFGWRLPPVHVIPNGIDDLPDVSGQAVSADVRSLTARKPLLLFLGRQSWKKGLDRLINAVAATETVNLAIVGVDDEGIGPELSVLAERLGIGGRVHFVSRMVQGPDKEAAFAAADLFALTSYSENFGNTVLEAMQRGLPVIVTPEVGAADIVRQSGGGIVVDGDPRVLANAITTIVKDSRRARAMGEKGRAFVSERYTWPRIASEMESLYGHLISATKR